MSVGVVSEGGGGGGVTDERDVVIGILGDAVVLKVVGLDAVEEAKVGSATISLNSVPNPPWPLRAQ